MKYNFFINKTITKINFLPDSGISLDFGEHEHFECHTKTTVSNEKYDLKKLVGKMINSVHYEKDNQIAFLFDDVSLSFSLDPKDWETPEDVTYKDYRDSKKLIIKVIT